MVRRVAFAERRVSLHAEFDILGTEGTSVSGFDDGPSIRDEPVLSMCLHLSALNLHRRSRCLPHDHN